MNRKNPVARRSVPNLPLFAGEDTDGLSCIPGQAGGTFAPVVPKSGGEPGEIEAVGTGALVEDVMTLKARHLPLGTAALPTPSGLVSPTVGQTWYLQAWIRDTSPQGTTTNFTDALAVTWQQETTRRSTRVARIGCAALSWGTLALFPAPLDSLSLNGPP